MTADDEVTVGDVTLGVRRAGAEDGAPVLYFHGTPGSRLELAWADGQVTEAGVHLVTFDRPGYGRSTQVPFSLSSVAALSVQLADALGWERFATLGWSGGGPFALATAAAAPDRVRAVGVISGAGPMQDIPGVLDHLDGGDAEGAALAASDPAAAAEAFASTFAPFAAALTTGAQLAAAFAPMLSERDRRVFSDPVIATAVLHELREAFAQGLLGGGWDNVAWVGPWDIDLDDVRCPVRLWYGDEDLMAPPVFGTWLADHLPDATLHVRKGYGHLAAFEHLPEMLAELVSL